VVTAKSFLHCVSCIAWQLRCEREEEDFDAERYVADLQPDTEEDPLFQEAMQAFRPFWEAQDDR
jgi:hypothetical protein